MIGNQSCDTSVDFFTVSEGEVTECYTDTVPEDELGTYPGTDLVQIFRDLEFG